MKTRSLAAAIIAAFVSFGAFAQSTPSPTGPPTGDFKHLTKGQRMARRQEMKAALAGMTPEERSAFKESHRAKLQEKWAGMTPEQREKAKAQLQARRERHGKPMNK